MLEKGFYIIKDEFFEYVNEPYLKGNKKNNRPHYYCFKDHDSDLLWMIPLSSRIEKYKKIVKKVEKNNKRCDIIHIVKLDNNKESVFLIQDIFPITEKYIEREYTIANNHFRITSEKVALDMEKKAKKVIKLLKNGIKFTPTQPDISKIIDKLNK